MISESRNLPTAAEIPAFGKRLQWLIENHEALGSQVALAERLNVKAPYIAELVAKTDPPGKQALRKLSKALRVPIPWLAYGVVDTRQETEGCGFNLEREWMEAYREIRESDESPEQKMLAVDALASIIGRIVWGRDIEAARERAKAVRSGDEQRRSTTAPSRSGKKMAAPVIPGTAKDRPGRKSNSSEATDQGLPSPDVSKAPTQ